MNDGRNVRRPDAGKKSTVTRKSGVVITGRPARNVSDMNGIERRRPAAVTPSRRELSEREIKRAEKNALRDRDWNSGIVRTKAGVDRAFLAYVLILLCLGTVMVFSASYPAALYEKHDGLFYIKKQLIFAVVGVVAMLIIGRITYRFYGMAAIPFYVVTALLLVAVLFIGSSEGVARRWLGIGSFTFQPSELMKPALVLILASYFQVYKDKIADRSNKKNYILRGVVVPLALVMFASGLVLLEKHLSGTAIIFAIGVTVMFIGGAHIGYTLLISAILGIAGGGIFIALNPYALERITTFGDPNADKLAEAWQTSQGQFAIGSGGLFGVGLGGSRQKYSYVSEAQNDFIFSIWCEEMGFIGAVAVIVLFALLIKRGFNIAMHAPDTFSALTVYGIIAHVGIQVILNIAVVTGTFPNTGVSLPFFSYGGSSLFIMMAEMGIVLSVSRHSFQKREI